MRRPALALALALLAGGALLGALVGGCETVEPPPFDGPRLLGGVEVSAEVLNAGRRTYLGVCRPCHGPFGDGQGPLGVHQSPKAADLRQGIIKFAAVAAGQLPRDEDLVRAIRSGRPGTAMLAWDVPEEEIAPVVQFIKTFAPRWRKESAGAALAVSPDPWSGREVEAVGRGAALFAGNAGCATCHGQGDRPPVNGATDLARGALRNGGGADDLYRVIAAGVGGTAMPSWKGALPEDDLWALAHYVRSLRPGGSR